MVPPEKLTMAMVLNGVEIAISATFEDGLMIGAE
jgi:hypothetical protein